MGEMGAPSTAIGAAGSLGTARVNIAADAESGAARSATIPEIKTRITTGI
jgi:hypothetical protein